MLGSSGRLSCQKLENHETITRFLFKIIAPRHRYEQILIFLLISDIFSLSRIILHRFQENFKYVSII